jgi:fermentation-respiration switch protein FrsA (DUF1100 family)
MRRNCTGGIFAVAGALVAAAILATALRSEGQIPKVSEMDHVVVARELVNDLAEKHFESLETHFNDNVARMLTPDVLRATWSKMTSDLGEFVGIKWAGHEQKQDLDYVYVTCHFSRKDIDLLFIFDALQKVAGFKTLPASSFGAWQTPSYANPASFIEIEMKIGQAPWVLPGTLAIPKGAGPFPAVVLVHGWGANDEDETAGADRTFKDIAWGLASHGVAVLRYVKRTKQYGSEVAKNLASLTVEQETVDDARAAVTVLAALHRIDAHHIYLLGEGFGGFLGPRIAAPDSQIAGLILMNAYARPLDDVLLDDLRPRTNAGATPTAAELEKLAMIEQEKRQAEDPSLKPGMIVRLGGTSIPSAYLLDLRGYSPTNVAAALRIPMLVLQPGLEIQSASADWEKWRTALRTRTNVTFKSYAGLDQSFLPVAQKSSTSESRHVPAEVIGDIARWVQHGSGSSVRQRSEGQR